MLCIRIAFIQFKYIYIIMRSSHFSAKCVNNNHYIFHVMFIGFYNMLRV